MLPAILCLLGDRAWWPMRRGPGRSASGWSRTSRRTSWHVAEPQHLDRHGYAVERGVPADVEPLGVGEVVDRDARRPSRRAPAGCRRPGGRSRGGARPRRASCRRSPRTSTSTVPTREVTATVAPSVDAARGEVVGVHQQLVARLAPGEPLGVVHPGVAVPLVPPADQQQLAVASGQPAAAPQPGRGRRAPASGARSIRLVRGLQPAGQLAGRSGPRSTPSGCLRSCRMVTSGPPGCEQAGDDQRSG